MTVSATKPLVSVIINCYNGEQFLKEAIDSVYAQTYPHWEIIFYDNNSTDQSANIAKAYGEKIQYIKRDNTIALYAARNEAVTYAKGPLLAFLDCDDKWLTHKLATQVKLLAQSDKALCYGSVYCIQENKLTKKIVKDHGKKHISKLAASYDIIISSALIQKKIFTEHGVCFNKNLQYLGDYLLFMTVSYRFGVIATSDFLAYYRAHPQNLSSQMHYLDKVQEFTFVSEQLKLSLSGKIYKVCKINNCNEIRKLYLKQALTTTNTKNARSIALKLCMRQPKFIAIVLLCCLPPGLSHWLIRNHLSITY